MTTTRGNKPAVPKNKPWDLRFVRAQSGRDYGFSVILHIGDVTSICVRPDTRVPTLFDRPTSDQIGRHVDDSLSQMYRIGHPITGETRGGGDNNYVYFTIPRDANTNFVFVVTDDDETRPRVRSFNMRKGAIAMLGEIIDRLAGGNVDWSKMLIPAETP